MARPAETDDRHARIAELKRQIAAGNYETPERLDAAVDALLDDLTAGDVPTDDDQRGRRAPK